MPTAILLLSCPDQPGLVASVANFIFENGGNIVHAAQHTDHERGVFFQRVQFDTTRFRVPNREISQAFEPIRAKFGMQMSIGFPGERRRVAVLASKEGHCLYDLLFRLRMRELDADVPLVISNHPEHEAAVRFFGHDYHCLPVEKGKKAEQERAVLELLERERIDLVVLARYMQILSGEFIGRFPSRIINIHHSFLPAFVGARPYHQAYERGVKLVGVTAHYATEVLDEGPIIEQDVVRVTHRDAIEDLIRKGRDLEKAVLARAVRAHLEHRILVYGNKTVVFGV